MASTAPAGSPVATMAGPAPDEQAGSTDLHIPGSFGRPYNPVQRTTLDGEDTLASVAAQIAAEVDLAAVSAPAPVAAGAEAPVASSTPLPTLGTPRVTPGSPEIFRPRPAEVAPMATADAPIATLAARWMADPTGRHQYRYWDGGHWTENVYDAGVESRDPVTD